MQTRSKLATKFDTFPIQKKIQNINSFSKINFVFCLQVASYSNSSKNIIIPCNQKYNYKVLTHICVYIFLRLRFFQRSKQAKGDENIFILSFQLISIREQEKEGETKQNYLKSFIKKMLTHYPDVQTFLQMQEMILFVVKLIRDRHFRCVN